MSKSFKEKRSRDFDSDDRKPRRNRIKKVKRHEKEIDNALKSRDVSTLIKYSEEME